MAQRNQPGDSTEDSTGTAASPPSRAGSVVTGLGALARSVSFWSAIVLPFVAVALLAVQPSGWVPAVAGVVALDVAAVYIGHCHDREC